MRSWLFHPLVFYPLVILAAALVIGFSLRPQMFPHPTAQVAGQIEGDSLLLAGDDFNSPTDPPEQYVTVVRDFWGRPQSLRIAVLPNLRAPAPSENGVEILLQPETAQLISNKRVTVEVTYQPLAVNAAPVLAMSLRGSQPARWQPRQIPPLSGMVRFDLPATPNVRGVGLRAVNNDPSLAFGVEILSIRVTPRAR